MAKTIGTADFTEIKHDDCGNRICGGYFLLTFKFHFTIIICPVWMHLEKGEQEKWKSCLEYLFVRKI